MLGNAFQLAGCLLPFVLLFNLDRFFKTKRSVTLLTRIASLIASSDRETEMVRRREIKLAKYEGAWYGAWSAGYIIIGYILATGEIDCRINTLLLRLFIFILITFVLVVLASGICSFATKKYADRNISVK